MAFDVFHDDDRVVHHQPNGQYDRQQRQQIEREPENLHEKDGANKRNRNRNDRREHGTPRAQEQKDHEHHDAKRLDQRFEDFVHRVIDVSGGVVGNARHHSRWQVVLD